MGEFFKLPKNPVFSGGSGWDRQDVADPFIRVTADSVIMWYDGSRGGSYSIGRALLDESGWNWQRLDRPLSPGKGWYTYHVIAPVLLPGNPQVMIFCGNRSDSELGYQTGLKYKRRLRRFRTQHPISIAGMPTDGLTPRRFF